MILKLTFLFSLSLSTLLGSASTIINGHFSEDINDSIHLYGGDYYYELDAKPISQLCVNDFQFKVDIDSPTELLLKWKDQEILIYLEPNDQLKLNLYEDNLTFSGKGGENNTFLKKAENFVEKVTYTPASGIVVDELEGLLYTQRSAYTKFAAGYKNVSLLSKQFRVYYSNQVKFRYYNGLLKYGLLEKNFDSTATFKKIPADFFSSIDLVELAKEPILMSSYNYRQFIVNYAIYDESLKNNHAEFKNHELMVLKVKGYSDLNYGEIQSEYVNTWILFKYCYKCAPEIVHQIYTEAKQSVVYPKCKLILDKKVKQTKKKKSTIENNVDESNMLPNISLKDINGKDVNLRSFKGKVVYIDFWASWCGPCRREIPSARKLKEQLSKKESKKIEFVYVSIDTDEGNWKRAVEGSGLKGIHLISPSGWASELSKKLNIHSIPRYMILDKNGAIINPNAPRPSNPELLELLKKML